MHAPSATPPPAEIRAWREAAGLTQTEAARLVHAGLRTWQQWEAGERRMHPAFWELARIKAAGKTASRIADSAS